MVRVLRSVDGDFKPTEALTKQSRLFLFDDSTFRLSPDSAIGHSHVDIVALHDAGQVVVGGKDPVETVSVDVRYDHLGGVGGWMECRRGTEESCVNKKSSVNARLVAATCFIME